MCKTVWCCGRAFRLFLVLTCSLLGSGVSAAETRTFAVIQDSNAELETGLVKLFERELPPLLPAGSRAEFEVLSAEGDLAKLPALIAKAFQSKRYDAVISTGFISSQLLYDRKSYPHPTFLLNVIDPSLRGIGLKKNTRNLHWYSSHDEIDTAFQRVKKLFDAERVGILVDSTGLSSSQGVRRAVVRVAAKNGIQAFFIPLDLEKPFEPQIKPAEVIIITPFGAPAETLQRLIGAINDKRIPSYEVAGNHLVRMGALISDSQEADWKTLSRRVALDIQSMLSGEGIGSSAHWIDAQPQTTINMHTAKMIGADFSFDELLNSRRVDQEGAHQTADLTLLKAMSSALDRNLTLRNQFEQYRVDEQTLEQARATRRPQISAAIAHNRRGDALPEQDSRAALSVSQSLYSAVNNTDVRNSALALQNSELNYAQVQLDTTSEVARAYLNALNTQAQLEISQRDLRVKKKNLTLAERQRKIGTGSGADVARWKATIAGTETSLINAWTTNIGAQTALVQLLNKPLELPIVLENSDFEQEPFIGLHEKLLPWMNSIGKQRALGAAVNRYALDNSYQFKMSKRDTEIADTTLRALKSAYWTPSLALTGQTWYYFDSSETASGGDLDGDSDWSVSLDLELPLWLGGTRRSLIRSGVAQRQQAEIAVESTELSVWQQSRITLDNLLASWMTIGTGKRAVDAALESRDIVQSAYRLGSTGVTELLDAQQEHRQAETDYSVARYNYLSQLINFQQLIGSMPIMMPDAARAEWLEGFGAELSGAE